MSNAPFLRIDAAQPEAMKQIFPRPPILSSHQAGWNGLHLEYHDQPPHETPEFYLEQHLVSIYVGTLEANLRINGIWQRESYRTGDIVVLPAYQGFKTGWDRDAEFIKLYLNPALLPQALTEGATQHLEIAPQLKLRDPLIHSIGLALKTELQSDTGSSRLYVETMVNALAVHLSRRYSTQKSMIREASSGLPQYKLKAVLSYIYGALDQELSLNELAAVVQISPHYFATLFKQSTGLTPHQYVIKCRIERAKQLLVKQELNIAAIAQSVGFQNQSHFTRVFRQYTAITPRAYRDRL